ncbi:hypothetical protein BJ912DRAFT_950854 [Pholiota molesta]|nr:hypothetical protein BJ912DRAFT_950854 [Pholiota molesta]
MAGITSVHSDSESSTKVTSKAKDKPAALDSAAASGDESQEEDGSEYEIEEVLDAKRGFFPDGRMGYFVKWKGYDHSENSWVDELDAGNAVDLVNEYWSKNPAKKKAAALPPKKSPKKARKSAGEETSDADASATRKRARKSSTKKSGNDEEDMDVDEAPPKKARKSSTQVSKVKARAPETPEVDEPVIGNMNDYMHMNNWEPLVKTVDTIERRQDGVLFAYFTLTTHEAVMEKLYICKQRFPQKLLDFYESNLRWRTIEEEAQ